MGQTIQQGQLKVLAMCDAEHLLRTMKDHGCLPGTQGEAVYTRLMKAYNRKASARLLEEAIRDFQFVFKARMRHDPEPFTKRELALVDLLWDYLKRDPEHKDRVFTGYGTKTKTGLVACINRIYREEE